MLSNTVQLISQVLFLFSSKDLHVDKSKKHEASDSIQLSCGCKSPDIVHTHLLMWFYSVAFTLCVLNLFSPVQSFAHQAPLSKRFSWQGYWSRLPCPPPGDLPNPGIEVLLLWKWKLLSRVWLLCDPMDYIVHGILQARILEWVAFLLSRESFPTQGLNPGLPHCRQILYQLSHKWSPRLLEWVAYPFSSRSSQPRNWTGVSCIEGGFFTNWALREACFYSISLYNNIISCFVISSL